MVGILNRRGLSEAADGIGQPARVIGHLHAMRDLRFGLSDFVDDGFFVSTCCHSKLFLLP